MGATSVHKQAAFWSAPGSAAQQGQDMTHEPELGVLIQTPLNSMGGFGSWAMRRQRLKALLKRLRQQHSKCRESLVLRVGYGTAPKQHGVATIGVCPGRRLLSASSSAQPITINQQRGLSLPCSAPGTSQRKSWKSRARGARLMLAAEPAHHLHLHLSPCAMEGWKNLHLHHLSASPTCVCIVPAMWQQPSSCSDFRRGGTQLGRTRHLQRSEWRWRKWPCKQWLHTLLLAGFFGLRRLTSHSRFAFPGNCFLCLKKLEPVLAVSYPACLSSAGPAYVPAGSLCLHPSTYCPKALTESGQSMQCGSTGTLDLH